MSIVIPTGRSWLRLQLVSPANFGSTGGRATLDRPVALDAWNALPFLPFSALTGVLAGRFGEVRNSRRATMFGSGDDESAAGIASIGRPGELTLGDGELFSFPMPLNDGRVAHVIPMTTVRRLVELGLLGCRIPRVSNPVVAYTMADGLPPGVETDADPRVLTSLFPHLTPLANKAPETLVLAAPEAAKTLWRAANDVRTLTAISPATKTVRAGSLRTVELLPAGSVLLSLVTNQSTAAMDLGSTRLQLGAWESWGCGYVEARVLVKADAPATRPLPSARTATTSNLDPQDQMVDAFSAIVRMPDSLRPKVRTIVRETATRMRYQGVPSTLAFLLAKAKFRAPINSEREAHRWVVAAIFPGEDGYQAAVEAIRGQRPTRHLEGVCHWLSRYAELPPYLPESAVTRESVS